MSLTPQDGVQVKAGLGCGTRLASQLHSTRLAGVKEHCFYTSAPQIHQEQAQFGEAWYMTARQSRFAGVILARHRFGDSTSVDGLDGSRVQTSFEQTSSLVMHSATTDSLSTPHHIDGVHG